MAVILLPERDTGDRVDAVELAERVLEVAPEAMCHMTGSALAGVEVADAAALAYLRTLDTATVGRET